jgi:hypothetical protein
VTEPLKEIFSRGPMAYHRRINDDNTALPQGASVFEADGRIFRLISARQFRKLIRYGKAYIVNS